ncbi:MAG: SIMPL domain-containing protein [Hyphomonadaceae bacterium]|nr:SIMPL domain-containing protein [Hyphomonadaceae bacterium]
MNTALPALAAMAALAAAPVAAAQDAGRGGHAMMLEGTALTVSAEARASARPDIATITTGVVTEAPTAEAALAANAQRMAAVIAAIKRAGVAERDIQTSQLSVQPQMVYGENVPPRVTGYQATNTVSVKVRAMANVGKTVDAVVGQGSNQLNGVAFDIDNPEPALDLARADAFKRARARADIYAAAAGMKVHRIVSIAEGGSVQPPMPVPMMAMARAAADTPVAPGEVTLTANVTVMFELR